MMKAQKDEREIKCYLCDKKLFSIRHSYEKFYSFCESCLSGLEKQEADQVRWLNNEREKMKQSKHFKHSSD